MILSCPNCEARFVVSPAAIGPTGRRVRCANCRHDWFADAPDESLEIVPEFVDQSAAGAAAAESSAPPPEEAAPEAEGDGSPAPEGEPEEETAPESGQAEEAEADVPAEDADSAAGESPDPEVPEEDAAEPEEAAEEAETPAAEDEPESQSESEDNDAEAADDAKSTETTEADDEGDASAPAEEIAEESNSKSNSKGESQDEAGDAAEREAKNGDEGGDESEEDDIFAQRSRRLKPKSLRSNVPAVKKDASPVIIGGWIALSIFILTTLGIVIFEQEFLLDTWPPSGKLYASLGMEIEVEQEEAAAAAPLPKPSEVVEFTHGAETEIVDGHIKLNISGKLKNNGTFAVEIPPMKGILRNAGKEEIHSWTFTTEPAILLPGEERRFSTIVEDIPPETAEFELFLEWPVETP